MSSEERRKILQMVADGKINAEDAAKLISAIEDSVEAPIEVIEAAPSSRSENVEAPEFEEVRRRARRFAIIPLWAGVLLTIITAWGMYTIQQGAGYNFWFFCLGMPLFFGVLLTALGAAGARSRWMYVNVDRSHQPDWPRQITIALPLPLGLVSWFLKVFGPHIEGLKQTAIDEVIQAIALTKSIREPLIVNVDESEGGERVQVFIG